jgi:hypothetical protein
MTTLEGKRVIAPVAKSTQASFPAGDYAEIVGTQLLPRNYNTAYMGVAFTFSSSSITEAAATVSPLIGGATTASPALSIWNPPGSGKNIVITKVAAFLISGTPSGPLVWNYGAYSSGTTATTSTVVSNIVGATPQTVAKVYSGVATTGAVTGTFYKIAAGFSAITALGTAEGNPLYEDTGGDIICPPGQWIALAGYAATTAHVYQCSVSWIEIPV